MATAEQTSSTAISQPSPVALEPLKNLPAGVQRRWINHLFAKLTAIFGDQFRRAYAVGDPEHVIVTWAEGLETFTANDIAYGLRMCMDRQYSPNLPEFAALCRLAPRQTQAPALPPPKPDPYLLNEHLTKLRRLIESKQRHDGDGRAWAREIIARHESGEYRYPAGYLAACEALGLTPDPRGLQRRLQIEEQRAC